MIEKKKKIHAQSTAAYCRRCLSAVHLTTGHSVHRFNTSGNKSDSQ